MSGFDLIIKPDEEDTEAAEILVDGTIGGRNYRFLLDTGAALTRVKCDAYISAFDSAEKRETSGVFSKSSFDLVVVPSIKLGPILKSNFTLARVAESVHYTNNLIGMDLLKDHSFYFHFDKNRVDVDYKHRPEADCVYQELTLGKKSHPYIDVYFGELKTRAVWDTGAGSTVVDSGFISKHPAFFRQVGQSTGTDSAGYTTQTLLYLMGETKIGGKAFRPHRVAAVDLSQIKANTDIQMDLIVGYNTMRQSTWFFDFPGKKWAVLKTLDSK